jgi:hypothetical protein
VVVNRAEVLTLKDEDLSIREIALGLDWSVLCPARPTHWSTPLNQIDFAIYPLPNKVLLSRVEAEVAESFQGIGS